MFHIDKEDVKKKRVVKLFIEAAAEIIAAEGIEYLTIRKVAEKTGYNSATIYSYFDNFRQLIFLASAASLHDYVAAMPDYIKSGSSPLEKFLLMWECFCRYSFKRPKDYYAVFSDNIGSQPEALVAHYYGLFPEELAEAPPDLKPMLKETDLQRRNMMAVRSCVDEGYFARDDEEAVEEAIRLIYQGMLTMLINKRVAYSPDEAAERTMRGIKTIVESYTISASSY